MHQDRFQLREPLFGVTPDPQFYYCNAANREISDALRRGIAQRQGVFVMIGAPGTGKTTLLRKLLESLEPDARTAFLSQTFPEDTTLLHLVAEDFDLPQPVDRAISMPEHLRCFFLDQLQRDKSVARQQRRDFGRILRALYLRQISNDERSAAEVRIEKTRDRF